MFFSLKRNVTSFLQTIFTLCLAVLCIYLFRTILVRYEDYQKLDRLESYSKLVENLGEHAEHFKAEAEVLKTDFHAVKEVVETSLKINLTHK